MSTILETNLVRTPGVCGGRLRIDGTRMTVNQIVTLHRQGLTPAEILAAYPHLTDSQVYTVIAWYYDHREEFDAELAAEAEADEAAARAHHAARPQ
jgi:uncharacterized protein (DUF433 family)